MRRTSFDLNCSMARAMEIVGEWWTFLILRDAFFGITRFDDFQRRLGIARNILATRLETLTGAGVFERRPYDVARKRYDYVLTDKGRALWPVLMTLRQWGDEWVTGQDRAPIVVQHRACGEAAGVHLVCDHCGERMGPGDVRALPGPGATPEDETIPSRAG